MSLAIDKEMTKTLSNQKLGGKACPIQLRERVGRVDSTIWEKEKVISREGNTTGSKVDIC